MMKKRFCALLLLCLFLAAAFSRACADPLGFGILNAGDVALRKSVRGPKITRLRKDTSVWITGSDTDSRGELWYRVRTQEITDSSRANRSGWIKAEFVDAGDALWHDVQAVKAAPYGMIALKTNGTVECAGADSFSSARERTARLRDIRRIGIHVIGWEFFAVDGGGRLWIDGDPQEDFGSVRLASTGGTWGITPDNRLFYIGTDKLRWIWPSEGGDALLPRVTEMTECVSRLLLLTDDGRVCAVHAGEEPLGYPEPDWAQWTDVVSVDSRIFRIRGTEYVASFAAVRGNGTVLAVPQKLADLVAPWQDITKVAVGYDWVLGLKRDGSVVAAGTAGSAVPDVSGWTDIVDIANGQTWCVGVRRGGSLVFAGSFDFSGE